MKTVKLVIMSALGVCTNMPKLNQDIEFKNWKIIVAIASCVTSNGDTNIKKTLFKKKSLRSLSDDFEKITFLLKIYFIELAIDNFLIVSSQMNAISIDTKMYPRKTRFLGSLKCSINVEKNSTIDQSLFNLYKPLKH